MESKRKKKVHKVGWKERTKDVVTKKSEMKKEKKKKGKNNGDNEFMKG